MEKNSLKSIKEMKKFASNMPKTISEAIDFEGGMNEMEHEEGNEVINHDEPTMDQSNLPSSSIDVEKYIDSVRKTALKGMAQLADNPESTGYQTLKKLWQICDKKPEETQVQPTNTEMQPRKI